MRNNIVLSYVLLVFSVFRLAAQDGIEFRDIAWEEALEVASKEQKTVFIAGLVGWSEPCQVLDQYAFSDKEVGKWFNQQFVNIKVDMEDFPGNYLAEIFEINSFPTLLFIDAKGELMHQACGAMNASDLLDIARLAQSDANLKQLAGRFEKGERTYDLLLNYSLALQDACLSTQDLSQLYFEEIPTDEWSSEVSWMMLNLNVIDPYSDQFQYLLKNKQLFEKKFGKDTVEAKIYNVMIDQLMSIYDGADLTLFATQALQGLMSQTDFEGKNELLNLADLKKYDLKQNWELYAEKALAVVKEQNVTDPDQLNEFGWKFYLFVQNPHHLAEARMWMADVIKAYPDATFIDTYASLCYKLGDKKLAVKQAKIALEMAEAQGEALDHYMQQMVRFEEGY